MLPDYSLRGSIRKQKAKAKDASEARQSSGYYQRFILHGERDTNGMQVVRCVSLKTSDAKTARQRAVRAVEEKIQQIEATKHAPVPTETQPEKSFAEHVADFQASVKADNRSAKHVKAIKQKLSHIATLAGITKLEQIEIEKIKTTIYGLVEKGEISEQTGVYYRTNWRAFGAWLTRSKRLAADPLTDMKRRSHQDVEQTQTRREFTKAELARLIRNARRNSETHYGLTGQQRALLYQTASETGFRVQELASVTPSSVTWDHDDPAITVECTISKRRKKDRQEIKVSTAKALRKLCRGLAPNAKIWPGRWWEKSARMIRCDMEGITEITPDGHLSFHSLRHTFVTNVARTGIDLQMILNICRLSSPTLLQRYYHSAQGQRRNVINQLP
jgi:integrase/recombinase XerD